MLILKKTIDFTVISVIENLCLQIKIIRLVSNFESRNFRIFCNYQLPNLPISVQQAIIQLLNSLLSDS